MRIRVNLKTKQLPVHYRMLFVSLIKEAIKTADENLYRKLYIESKNAPKKYSFAIYLSNFKKVGNLFELDDASMTISSSDPQISVALINGLQNINHFSFKNWNIELGKLELLKEKNINSPLVTFTTLSPFLLENKHNKPLLITDSDFEKEMNIICNQQFLSLYGRNLISPLKVVNHHLKKQVIQESNRVSGTQPLFFTCQKGILTLKGNIEDLKLIYQDGFLCRKSQGFGSLEVVNSFEGGEIVGSNFR